jgi:hypothetical protein
MGLGGKEMINKVKSDCHDDILFVYIVHGNVPEFMPYMAFRRDRHFKAAGKKIIKCPHCKNTFTTVNKNEKIILYRHSKKADITWHDSLPCQTCRNKVGIIFASA